MRAARAQFRLQGAPALRTGPVLTDEQALHAPSLNPVGGGLGLGQCAIEGDDFSSRRSRASTGRRCLLFQAVRSVQTPTLSQSQPARAARKKRRWPTCSKSNTPRAPPMTGEAVSEVTIGAVFTGANTARTGSSGARQAQIAQRPGVGIKTHQRRGTEQGFIVRIRRAPVGTIHFDQIALRLGLRWQAGFVAGQFNGVGVDPDDRLVEH